MISVRFVAEDKISRQKTYSTLAYFDKLDETVVSLIKLNRGRILKAMPFCRVFAIIKNEGGSNDQLFL